MTITVFSNNLISDIQLPFQYVGYIKCVLFRNPYLGFSLYKLRILSRRRLDVPIIHGESIKIFI
jgi:hypothetical protein